MSDKVANAIAKVLSEADIPQPWQYQSCRWCAMGYEPIQSSVSAYQVHPDSPVGRVLCGIQDNELAVLAGVEAARLKEHV